MDLTTGPLTPDQRLRKNKYEAKIRTHIASFWEAGEALMGMHDEKLYREEFTTFEQYCDIKWHFSDRHARRLIFGSQVVNEIGPVGPLVTERAIREFTPLEPTEYQPTWEQVLQEAKGGRITASLVKRVVKAAANLTMEIVQTQGHVSVGEDSVALAEASITERMREDQSRQLEHITANSQWERLETFEGAAGSVTRRLLDLGLAANEVVKVSIYTRKVVI